MILGNKVAISRYILPTSIFNKQFYFHSFISGLQNLHYNHTFQSKSNLTEPPLSYDQYGLPSDTSLPNIKISRDQNGEPEIQSPPITKTFLRSHKKKSRFSFVGYDIDKHQSGDLFWKEVERKEKIESITKFNSLNKNFPKYRKTIEASYTPSSDILQDAQSNELYPNKSSSTPELIENLDNLSIRGNIGSWDPLKFNSEYKNNSPPLNISNFNPKRERDNNQYKAIDNDSISSILKDITNPLEALMWFNDQSINLSSHSYTSILSKICRITHPSKSNIVTQHPHFNHLMENIEYNLPKFFPSQLVSIFSSLSRLKKIPRWINNLLEACIVKSSELTLFDLSSCLSTLVQSQIATESSRSLTKSIYRELEIRLTTSFIPPQELIILLKYLGWAKTIPDTLINLFSDKIDPLIFDLDNSQLLIVIRTFAKLNIKSKKISRKIGEQVSKNIHEFGAQEIVKITWGLSKMGAVSHDFYNLFLSPPIRNFLPHYNSRELSIIIKAYETADVADYDLFHDLVSYLRPHVDQLLPDELSEVASSLVKIQYQNKQFYEFLKHRSIKLVDSFTPIKLIKNIYAISFSGITDAKYYYIMCNKAMESINLLKPPYLFRILDSLYRVDYLSHPIVNVIYERLIELEKSNIFAEEAIIALKCIVKLNTYKQNKAYTGRLFQILFMREKTWRCLTKDHVIELLKCQIFINHFDNKLLLLLFQRLHRFIGGPDSNNFFSMVKTFLSLPFYQRSLLRTQIELQPEILNTLSLGILNYSNSSQLSDLDTIELLFLLAKLGYQSDLTNRMHDEICTKADNGQISIPIDSFIKFLWAQTQINYNIDWTSALLKKLSLCLKVTEDNISIQQEKQLKIEFLQDSFHNSSSKKMDCLILFTWSCLALNQLESLNFFDKFLTSKNCTKLPQEIELAQQIAFHLTQLTSPECKNKLFKSTFPLTWASEILNFTNTYNHTKSRFLRWNKQPKEEKIITFSNQISDELLQMNIPHEKGYFITNSYFLPISFPSKKVAIDILDTIDVKISPNKERNKFSNNLTTCDLRQKQVVQLGWHLHTVDLRDLQKIHENNKLSQFIGEIINSFDPDVKRSTQLT